MRSAQLSRSTVIMKKDINEKRRYSCPKSGVCISSKQTVPTLGDVLEDFIKHLLMLLMSLPTYVPASPCFRHLKLFIEISAQHGVHAATISLEAIKHRSTACVQ